MEEESLREEIRLGFHFARAISLFNFFFIVLMSEGNERRNNNN